MRRERFLSKMKRIEIVVESGELDAVVKLVQTHATGYTIVPGITGFGEHGLREKDMVLIVTVITESHLEAMIEAILPSLSERANIVLVSDVSVLRAEHFIPEVRAAVRRSKV